MRIAIDFRILVVGREQVKRGMGRFTQQQCQAVLRSDAENEYLVLCDGKSDTSLMLPEIRSSPNVFLKFPPAWAEPTLGGLGDPASHLQRSAQFQDWIYQEDVDLFHSTTPFLLWEPINARFDACPLVATLYDLIPLVFPDRYLTEPYREPYLRALAHVSGAARLLAISESARTDASMYIGFPRDRIDVAFPLADEIFQPMPYELARGTLRRLIRRTRIPERFILTVSATHHTKNLDGLLKAFSLLPSSLRMEMPLVVCCHLNDYEVEQLGRTVNELGIADGVVFTGLVSDQALAALYNCATLVVHPSRYEGFGLPVLEAMSCGTPVITTLQSSLPEVAGDAAILVDSESPQGFADAITLAYRDAGRREWMGIRGLAHATRFTPAQLAGNTLACYRRAVGPAPERPGERLPIAVGRRTRVAMWTPLPPQQSGIADYSVELIDELSRHCDVEVFADDHFQPDARVRYRFKVHSFRAFERRHSQQPFDVTIYQMGNSKFHWYMYESLLAHPGIVVLHDLGWSHVMYDRLMSEGKSEQFYNELALLEGDATRVEFQQGVFGLTGAAYLEFCDRFLFRHPMLGRIVSAGLMQIVHSEEGRRQLLARYPQASPVVVEMGVSDPYSSHPEREVVRARRSEGYGQETFVLGAFGIVHPVKRLESCLRALPAVVRRHADTVLVITGRTLEDHYRDELMDLAAGLGVAAHVRFKGQVSRSEYHRHLIACDAVVNLRSPSASHMSATLIRSIAAGKPVVISDLPDWEGFSGDFCLRVPQGDLEVQALESHLVELAGRPEERRRMAAAAREYFLTHATTATMAERYLDAIRAAGRPDLKPAGLATVGR